MDASALSLRLAQIPRLALSATPTPLEPLPALSAELKRPLFVKRDDELGRGLGGNKTRKLEYLLAVAQQRGHRKVVTFGGLQSNHARLTAAAANQLGMETHLFYFEPRPAQLRGNLLVNHLLGAHLHFIPFGGSSSASMTLEASSRLVRWIALALVGRHYFIPVGGHTWRGCLGYLQAALELHAQARALNLETAVIFTAAGSGGTLAGLMAGLALLDSPLQVVGIDVGKLWKGFPASIATLANQILAQLGGARRFTAGQVPLIAERYVGERYGAPSPAGLAAMQRFARCEGLLLDPVYTAKAAAGMLDLLQQGTFGSSPAIFLHTGGLPALFAFDADQILTA